MRRNRLQEKYEELRRRDQINKEARLRELNSLVQLMRRELDGLSDTIASWAANSFEFKMDERRAMIDRLGLPNAEIAKELSDRLMNRPYAPVGFDLGEDQTDWDAIHRLIASENKKPRRGADKTKGASAEGGRCGRESQTVGAPIEPATKNGERADG